MKKLFKYIIFLSLAAFIGIFYLLPHEWNGEDKFSYVTMEDSGDVGVIVLDPKLKEQTILTIPGDTEVEVSRSYGTMRIKNVWQLGVNEKIGGRLLTETITRNFYFPVTKWWNEDVKNISLSDQIYATLFIKKIKSLDRNEINLGESQFLKKVKLNDGEMGYRLNGPISSRLTVYFLDNKIEDSNLRIYINDSTGRSDVIQKVGGVLEVFGGKVVAIDKKQVNSELDCEVSGINNQIVEKVKKLFDCKIVAGQGKFDLEVFIGSKFAKRF